MKVKNRWLVPLLGMGVIVGCWLLYAKHVRVEEDMVRKRVKSGSITFAPKKGSHGNATAKSEHANVKGRMTEEPVVGSRVDISKKVGREEGLIEPKNWQGLAKDLYHAKRDCDEKGYDLIIVKLLDLFDRGNLWDKRQALKEIIHICLHRGDRDRAEEYLRKMIEICSTDSPADGAHRQFAERRLQNIEKYLDESLLQRMEYQIGRLMGTRKYKEAIELAKEMYIEGFGQKAKHAALWHVVEAAYRTGEFAVAREALLLLREGTVDPEETRRILAFLGRCSDPEESVDIYRDIIKNCPEDEDPGEHYLALGMTLKKIGDKEEAIRAFREYLAKNPDGEQRELIQLRLGGWLIKEAPNEAIRNFEEMKKNVAKTSPLGRGARYYEAKTHSMQGDYRKAAEAYEQMIYEYPFSSEADRGFRELGVLEKKMELQKGTLQTEELRDIVAMSGSRNLEGIEKRILDFEAKHGKSEVSERLRLGAIRHLVKRRSYERAKEMGRSFLRGFADSKRASEVRFFMSKISYDEHKYVDAAKGFEAFLEEQKEETPLKSKGQLYLGICFLKLKEAEKAQEMFELAAKSTDPYVRKVANRYAKTNKNKGLSQD